MADRWRLTVTAQLLNGQTLRVVESRLMAPAAGHKYSVHHTRSAEHKCSAYTPFALHVLLHFTPRGISPSCRAAVSVGRQDSGFTADTCSLPQEVYNSTRILTITARIWGSSVRIGTRLRIRRCRVRILLPSRDFHLLVMVLPSRSHVTFPSLVFLYLLLKKIAVCCDNRNIS